MYIKNLQLINFRNYKDLDISFSKSNNIILGNNAQGKTNLIESIYTTSIGKSFRTNKDTELINFEADYCKIIEKYIKDDEEEEIELYIGRDSKKAAKANGVKLQKTSQLLNNIYIVIFSPEDLRIVKDEPEKRRKFINRELCQLKKSYYSNFVNYNRVLFQRNAYLKEKIVDPSIIEVWDLQLAKYGARITKQREEFINKINTISCDIHKSITNGLENLIIEYSPGITTNGNIEEIEKEYYIDIRNSLENDIRLRTTSKGPHKDDLKFYINGIDVRHFGSQGQQRTSALSLKLAEIFLIKEEIGENPILLLDDVLSELDINRQKYLIKTLKGVQLFITTTEINEQLSEDIEEKNIYYVENGIIKK